jgi:hypothetical protein
MTVHRNKFLIIKPTRCTNFSNLFFETKLYMFRTVTHQEIFTLHTEIIYVIQICSQLESKHSA